MGYFLKIFLIIHFWLGILISCYSQIQKPVIVINNDSGINYDFSEFEKKLSKADINDSVELINLANVFFADEGFLKVSIDSIIVGNESTSVYLSTGAKFYFKLRQRNLSNDFIQKSENKNIIVDKVFEYSKLKLFEKQIITFYENNGYPLASISKNNIVFDNDTIIFDWHLDKGSQFLIEEIKVVGNVNLMPTFISGITRLRANSPYSDQKIKNAEKKLSNLEFAELTLPPGVKFTPAGAVVELPLQVIRANRFDGIAGLVSVPSQNNASDYRITGQLNLYLINSLGYGEFLDMKWRAPGEGSQQLEIATEIPYVLSTPIKLGYGFFMNKQDSSFILVRQRPEVSFVGYGLLNFSTFAVFETNNIIASSLSSGSQGSYYANYKKNLYGIEIKLKSGIINHTFNKGWLFRSSIATGSRIIDAQNTDDYIPEKSTQIVSESAVIYHLPIYSRSLFAAKIIANIQSGRTFLDNEFYRIGGFSSLKGFDEASIKASSYSIISFEYRYYLASETFFSTLINAAWVESYSASGYVNNFPWGLAAGLHFKTKPGILSVYYALGKSSNEDFQFRNAKIHIGFTSIF
jgi:translocation and assembly module TamA